MKLDIITQSIVEATDGLGITWRSNIAVIPLEDTNEALERREINGNLSAGDIGFFIRLVVPDEDTELEPEAWANLIVAKLSEGILNLSMYMNNAAVDIKKKSRELASWERKIIGLQDSTQFKESPTEES